MEKPVIYPTSRNPTIDIAPNPAAPAETLIKYLPALLPADKKSVTLFIKPLVKLTE